MGLFPNANFNAVIVYVCVCVCAEAVVVLFENLIDRRIRVTREL